MRGAPAREGGPGLPAARALAAGLLVWAATVCTAAVSAAAPAPEPDGAEPPSGLQVNGLKTWSVKYAWGDLRGLDALDGYRLNELYLDQSLAVDVTGKVAPGVRVDAHLDDHQAGNLQLLTLRLDGGPVRATFGDFRHASPNPYTVYSKRLRGIDLDLRWGPVAIRLDLARLEGLSASRTFRGTSAAEQVMYRAGAAYAPQREAGGILTGDWRGLAHLALREAFDPDFMEVRLRYDDAEQQSLEAYLNRHLLGFLYRDAANPNGVLAAGDAVVVPAGAYAAIPPGAALDAPSGQAFLVLKRSPLQLLRDQIRLLVVEYSRRTGEDRRYPWVVGSPAELDFLVGLLRDHVRLQAGPAEQAGRLLDAPLPDCELENPTRCERGRFYDLGNPLISPGSVRIVLHRAADGAPVPAEQIPGLRWQILEQPGILNVSPSLDAVAAMEPGYRDVEVSYRYTLSGGIYLLGANLVRGSERVYLNGQLLQRGADYHLDEELGVLTLFRVVSPSDTIRVDYEFYAGPLGAARPFKTDFLAASLTYDPQNPASEQDAPATPSGSWTAAWQGTPTRVRLEVVQSRDQRPPVLPDDVPTLPNTHTVAGLYASFAAPWPGQAGAGQARSSPSDPGAQPLSFNRGPEPLSVEVAVGFSHDEAPVDLSARPHQPNAVSALLADPAAGVLFAGHRAGLSVGRELVPGSMRWVHYGPGQGLGGQSVLSAAATERGWLFGTENGLTFVTAPAEALDRVDSWQRYYPSNGLPAAPVQALAVVPVPLGPSGAAPSGEPQVWVGTPDGLASASLSRLADGWKVYTARTHPGLPSDRVHALTFADGRLFVGTDRGLAEIDASAVRGVESVPPSLAGAPVWALAVSIRPGWGPALFVAGPKGLWRFELSARTWQQLDERPAEAVAWSGGYVWYTAGGQLYAAADDASGAAAPFPVAGPDGLPLAGVTALAPDPGLAGGIWAATLGRGGSGPELWHIQPAAVGRDRSSGAMVRFPASATGIAAEDPRRFRDPDTVPVRQGAAGRVRVSQRLGRLTLQGLYETVEPGFAAIGWTERRDLQRWQLEARYRFSPHLEARIAHGEAREGLRALDGPLSAGPATSPTGASPPSPAITRGEFLAVGWSPDPLPETSAWPWERLSADGFLLPSGGALIQDALGPSTPQTARGAALTVGRATVDDRLDRPGSEKLVNSFRLDALTQWLEGRADAGFTLQAELLQDLQDPPASRQRHHVGATMAWRPLDGVSVRAEYARPVTYYGLSPDAVPGPAGAASPAPRVQGEEQFRWELQAQPTLGSLRLSPSYREFHRVPVGDVAGQPEEHHRRLALGATLQSWRRGLLTVAPSAELVWSDYRPSQARLADRSEGLGGRLSVDLRAGMLQVRSSFEQAATRYPEHGKEQRQQRLALETEVRWAPGLTQRFLYRASQEHAISPRFGEQLLFSTHLQGRLEWQPAPWWKLALTAGTEGSMASGARSSPTDVRRQFGRAETELAVSASTSFAFGVETQLRAGLERGMAVDRRSSSWSVTGRYLPAPGWEASATAGVVSGADGSGNDMDVYFTPFAGLDVRVAF